MTLKLIHDWICKCFFDKLTTVQDILQSFHLPWNKPNHLYLLHMHCRFCLILTLFSWAIISSRQSNTCHSPKTPALLLSPSEQWEPWKYHSLFCTTLWCFSFEVDSDPVRCFLWELERNINHYGAWLLAASLNVPFQKNRECVACKLPGWIAPYIGLCREVWHALISGEDTYRLKNKTKSLSDKVSLLPALLSCQGCSLENRQCRSLRIDWKVIQIHFAL